MLGAGHGPSERGANQKSLAYARVYKFYPVRAVLLRWSPVELNDEGVDVAGTMLETFENGLFWILDGVE